MRRHCFQWYSHQLPLDLISAGGNLSYVVRADANRLAFNYATDPNANSNSQFTMLTHEASTTTYRGHHCGAAPDFAALGFKAGQQLTIQARWTAGTKQTTLYQCADITLVDRALYVAPAGAMCFTGALTTATVDNNDYTDDLGGAGLTAGQKAGIAVGSVLGGLLLLGAAVYGVRKYRKNAATAKAANYGDDASTLNGAGTPPAVMSQKQLA
ncbi:hypothetical protein EMMF5_001304 [Cystobasidiomycetes sp. EMM_F5]